MSASAAPGASADDVAPADWPLRIAQRAFAALLENATPHEAAHAAFRAAQLRSIARRTWSTLSADSQARLARWLTVQLATAPPRDAAGHALARIDAALAATVAGTLAHTREELGLRDHGGAAAA